MYLGLSSFSLAADSVAKGLSKGPYLNYVCNILGFLSVGSAACPADQWQAPAQYEEKEEVGR